MELNQLSERVYYLPQEDETDRPNLIYVLGKSHSLAIDAGNSKAHVDKFYSAIRQRGFRLPDYTAITHWHWDHTYGMHAVNGITITGHRTHQKLQSVMNWYWTDDAMKQRLISGEDIEMADRDIRKEYPDRSLIKVQTADIFFQGEITVDLGGLHCRLTEITAPHSRDSVAVYIPEEKVLAVGDADYEDVYENGGKYDPALLHSMISWLQANDFDLYLRGHDTPQTRKDVMDCLLGEYAICQKTD